jgi:hypothetical protein
MRRHDLADSLAGGSARVNSATHGGNISTHDRGHQACIDLLPPDEANIRRFDHCVRSLDHRHETSTFDHSECFRHQLPPKDEIVTK